MTNYLFKILLLLLASISTFSFESAQNKPETVINPVEVNSESLLNFPPESDSSLIEIPFSVFTPSDPENLNMKVYRPDTILTEKMPILVPEPIDEKMVIPQFQGKAGTSKLRTIQ